MYLSFQLGIHPDSSSLVPYYNQNSLCNKTTHSAAEEPAAPLHGPRKHSRRASTAEEGRKEKERVRLGEIEAAEVITTREFAHREEKRRGGRLPTLRSPLQSSEGGSASRRKKVKYVEEKEAPIKSIFRGSFVLGRGEHKAFVTRTVQCSATATLNFAYLLNC